MMESRIRRIVHASDFSRESRPAFAKAVALAKACRAELVLLHVFSLVQSSAGGGYIASRSWKELGARTRAVAEAELARLVVKARKARVRVKGLVVVGNPFEDIVRAAKRQRADLLVMGTHGRTGLRKALLGSVAERVLRTSICPVMTVRGAKGQERARKS